MDIVIRIRRWFDRQRLQLAAVRAALLLAALGMLAGLASGIVIVAFRLIVEWSQAAFMPGGTTERYEDLAIAWRFLLPALGGLVIGLAFHRYSRSERRVGVVHVIERLNFHQGYMPRRNLLVQFFGGAVALISGHPVGRESPSVHLGAGVSSLFASSLRLPNNAMRTMIACGAAAGIAASFNTPLAGVVFAMEVVLMEYTIAGFTPIILATVVATVMTRLAFGPDALFVMREVDLGTLWELPYIALMGITAGAVSAVFVAGLRAGIRHAERMPFWRRAAGAGVLVGLIGLFLPEVLGMGYDTVNAAMLGQLGIGMLIAVVIFKLAASIISLAGGLPGGLIGPAVVIGATLGGVFGILGDQLIPGSSGLTLYVMLGMAALMGAALQAPLAALIALLELTGAPGIIFPGMFAVVIASLSARELFKQESVFLKLLQDAGMQYRDDPLSQSLRRIGVAAVMNRRIVTNDRELKHAEAAALLAGAPQWIIVRDGDTPRVALPAADLALFMQTQQEDSIDLLKIPGQRLEIAPIFLQATLQEARETLSKTGAQALYVQSAVAPLLFRIDGILLPSDIEMSYAIR